MGLRDRTASLVRADGRFSGWLRSRATGAASGLRPLIHRPLVMSGQEGVELFYDTERVARGEATAAPIARSLYGQDAVHTLDDAAHRHRKQLFVDVTAPELVADLRERVSAKWTRELDRWVREGNGTVIPAAATVFGEAAQEWAGAADDPAVMARRSLDLSRITDGSSTPSMAWIRARRARRRADAWATRVINEVRQGRRTPEKRTAAWVMAHATDLEGHLLPAHTAGVELLNVLRPTVAVAYLAAHAALELEANPDLADRCATGEPAAVEKFCQEIRRTSPFVPPLAGRSRCPFTWHGHQVDEGERVFLDVYRTDNDPRAWTDAETFDPDRFRSGAAGRLDFIPQGGGQVETGHRCPGEGITMALLRTVVPSLARLDWRVHPADRAYSRYRVPARPAGGVRLLDVRRSQVLRAV
jgi:fatty-acid peroxygenase